MADNIVQKLVGGGLSSYVGIDAMVQIMTGDALLGTVSSANELAGTAFLLVLFLTGFGQLLRTAGVLKFESPSD